MKYRIISLCIDYVKKYKKSYQDRGLIEKYWFRDLDQTVEILKIIRAN